MSDLTNAGCSGLSDRWALVNTQGELEGSDGDLSSSSSSNEGVGQDSQHTPGEKGGAQDHPASYCESASQPTELEELMELADAKAAAAAAAELGGLPDREASGVTTAPVDSLPVFHLSLLPHSSWTEPQEGSCSRTEQARGEESNPETASAQPSPHAASHAHTATQTDHASPTHQASLTGRSSPVWPERRLSLSSLWSFSSESRHSDTGSSDLSSSPRASDGEELSSSSDADVDTESEFVYLESEPSSSSASSSGVKARTGSRSSVGSQFKFLSSHEPPGQQQTLGGSEEVTGQEAACRHAWSSSSSSSDEIDAVLPPADDHLQEAMSAEGKVHATVTRQNHAGQRCSSLGSVKFWLRSRRCGFLLVAVLMLLLAFGLGRLWGMRWKQCQQLETCREELQQVLDGCLHRYQSLQETMKMQQEVMTRLDTDHSQLVQGWRETQHQLEELFSDRRHPPPHPDKGTAKNQTATTGNTPGNRERKRQPPEDAKDAARHLYFSMRDERDIGMNLTQTVNLWALLQSFTQSWTFTRGSNPGWKWTDCMPDMSSLLLSTLSVVPKTVVPAVCRAISATLSHTYQAVSTIHRHAEGWHSTSGAREGKKTEQKAHHQWSENKDDDEACVEDVEDESVSYVDDKKEGKRAEENEDKIMKKREEHEHLEREDSDQVRAGRGTGHKTEDDHTHRGSNHRKRQWGIRNKLLKKTQKAFTRFGGRLQKIWHKVKDRSWQLWSEDSVFSRMTAQVQDSINQLSAKFLKKAQRWFKKHAKGKKHSAQFNRQEKKTGEKARSSKQHKKREKDQKDTRSDEENTQRFNQHDSDRVRDGVSEEYDSERKEGVSNKASQGKQKGQTDKLAKRKTGERSENGGKNGKQNEKAEELERDPKNKEFTSGQDDEKDDRHGKTNEEKPNSLNKRNNEGRRSAQNRAEAVTSEHSSRNESKQRPEKRGENHFENGPNKHRDQFHTQHTERSSTKAPTHERSSSDAARLKLQLQSQQQELFAKVGSLTREAFRHWSRGKVGAMAEDVMKVAERYNAHQGLGLPATGSQWLLCQQEFWISVVPRSASRYQPPHHCLQFLARWQTALLEEGRDDTAADDDNDGGDEVPRPPKYCGGEDFGTDFDEEFLDSIDDKKRHHVPKGQREERDRGGTLRSNPQQASGEEGEPWYIHRAEGRSSLRSEAHKADWVFERATERDASRQAQRVGNWVFERAAHRDLNRH
ncbi:uncharacterized protein LOC143297427 [Babylonia areolata]|uniref:uncharacterized protein LOC143297427 n=1 Tax=Babylonia areolata TaxID=304850 RepID=UPI003FCF4403